MMSISSSLVLLAGMVVAASAMTTPSQKQAQCVARCENHSGLGKSKMSSCQEYVTMRPAPKMFRICDNGYRGGVVSGCEYGCDSSSSCNDLQLTTPKTSLAAVCGRYKSMLPRPLLYDICKDGFLGAFSSECMMSKQFTEALYASETVQQAPAAQEVEEVEENVDEEKVDEGMALRGADVAVPEDNSTTEEDVPEDNSTTEEDVPDAAVSGELEEAMEPPPVVVE